MEIAAMILRMLAFALILSVPAVYACSPAPGDVYACGGPNDSLLNRNAPAEYGTSTRIITGHDGQRSVEVAPAFGPDSEVRVIDYSGGHVTEDVIDQYGVHELD